MPFLITLGVGLGFNKEERPLLNTIPDCYEVQGMRGADSHGVRPHWSCQRKHLSSLSPTKEKALPASSEAAG